MAMNEHEEIYYSGTYDGDGAGTAELSINILMYGSALITLGVIYLFFDVCLGRITALNLINLSFYSVGLLFLILGLKDYSRTQAIASIRRGKLPKNIGIVWKGKGTVNAVGDSKSWAETDRICYRISFFDRDFGPDNAKRVYDVVKNTSGIIWINPFIWLIVSAVCASLHLALYEFVVPYYAIKGISDQILKSISVISFYLPSILVTCCGIICFVNSRIRDSILYKCALRIAEENVAELDRRDAETFIENEMSMKWFHNRCPNCGADAVPCKPVCTQCGTSLEVSSTDVKSSDSIHRLSDSKINAQE